MSAEELLKDKPIYYKDGNIEMRLVLVEPNIAICLEWNCNGAWIEVSSMRPAAFNAFLREHETKSSKIIN